MSRRLAFLAALTFAVLPAAARAGIEPPPPPDIIPQSETTPQFALVQVLSQPVIDKSWFSEAFLKTMTPAQLQSQLNALHQNLGSFFSSRPVGDYYDIQFTKGRARAHISLVKSLIDTLVIYDQVTRSTDQGSFRLAQIFQAAPPIPGVLFSAGFLRSYPLGDLDKLVARYKHSYGKYRAVTIAGNEAYVVEFDRGVMGARLHLDEDQKVDGLSFEPVATLKPGG